jgi:hypothetical protein
LAYGSGVVRLSSVGIEPASDGDRVRWLRSSAEVRDHDVLVQGPCPLADDDIRELASILEALDDRARRRTLKWDTYEHQLEISFTRYDAGVKMEARWDFTFTESLSGALVVEDADMSDEAVSRAHEQAVTAVADLPADEV